MKSTVSSKYQIVIPKAVRRQLGLMPGQSIEFGPVNGREVTISKSLTADEYFQKFAGSIKTADTAWGKAGMDATAWLRQQRDNDR